jgi:hypothetical protein
MAGPATPTSPILEPPAPSPQHEHVALGAGRGLGREFRSEERLAWHRPSGPRFRLSRGSASGSVDDRSSNASLVDLLTTSVARRSTSTLRRASVDGPPHATTTALVGGLLDDSYPTTVGEPTATARDRGAASRVQAPASASFPASRASISALCGRAPIRPRAGSA